jgi:SAM-dependent methyltransferase
MGILTKAKKSFSIPKMLYESLKKQNEILNKVRAITDSSILDKHRMMCGTYTNSDGSELKSSVCRMQDLLDYNKWMGEIGQKNLFQNSLPELNSVFNRKAWEFIFIVQALFERGMLAEGKKGLGFAVGKEPLPSLFAKYGCKITATDIDSSTEAGRLWEKANQHGSYIDDLYKADICDKNTFNENVNFNFLDMNAISDDFTGFDFCWSSCAFEHLGSIQNGKQFIYNMLKCLKPGGVAVHTTEYNISSYFGVDIPGNSLFGRSDFIEIRNNLISKGHYVEELDFRLGIYSDEDYVAYPPYKKPHFKLSIESNICTSFALIIKKK